jgi:hypothetical protein
MSRTARAWERIRKQGGSIIGADGTNMTGDPGGSDAFEEFMKASCVSSPGKLHAALQAMEEAAEAAAEIAAMNALPTTDPKCYSKPMVRVLPGCDVEWELVARNRTEQNCSGG